VRDLVHLAVPRRVGAGSIVAADADFDAVDRVTRLDPTDVARWGAALER
jgi:predicted nucleic acid-binding protein